MRTYLEIWRSGGPELFLMESDKLTVGKDADNDVVVTDDRAVSRMHAVLERYRAGWCVRDLASSNGTFVNGERIWGERPLQHGDEIRVGGTRLVYRSEKGAGVTLTETADSPPELTRRERDVLVALCRPLLSATVFTEPASIREMAQELVVTEAAVKQHLLNLYAKFGLIEGEHRRVSLANEAVRRGAVTRSDVKRNTGAPNA